jgi:hypothetical protein
MVIRVTTGIMGGIITHTGNIMALNHNLIIKTPALTKAWLAVLLGAY